MKVLFVTHQLAFNIFGGAEVQMLKTKEHLERLGVYVKLFDMWNDKIEDYDILHLFSPGLFPYESLSLVRTARKKGVKAVISPIFWFSYKCMSMSSIKKRVAFHKIFWPLTRNIHRRYYTLAKLFNEADVLLPNSSAEMKQLIILFRVNPSKFVIVPNGVDPSFKLGDPSLFEKTYGLRDFILYVGRIDLRKNVLGLIRAFRKLNLNTKLVIIGKITEKAYYAKCQKEANKNVIFIGPFKHDDPLLRSAYSASQVVVLPSFYETPGLAALEGALAGSNIVITREGGTRDYFGDHAWYVDPFDLNSIAKAIKEAYLAPKSQELPKIIEEKFTWKNAALKTLQAYELLCGRNTVKNPALNLRRE